MKPNYTPITHKIPVRQMTMKKILLAEDDQLLARALKEVLTKQGYQIQIAHDGLQVLGEIKTFKPDLLILDILMPRLDGISALQELKQDEATRTIPVIVLTNLSDFENVQKVMDLGVRNFLVKSDWGIDKIAEKVEEVLKD